MSLHRLEPKKQWPASVDLQAFRRSKGLQEQQTQNQSSTLPCHPPAQSFRLPPASVCHPARFLLSSSHFPLCNSVSSVPARRSLEGLCGGCVPLLSSRFSSRNLGIVFRRYSLLVSPPHRVKWNAFIHGTRLGRRSPAAWTITTTARFFVRIHTTPRNSPASDVITIE